MHEREVSNLIFHAFHNPFPLPVFTVSSGTYICTLCPIHFAHASPITQVSLFFLQAKHFWVPSIYTLVPPGISTPLFPKFFPPIAVITLC